VQGAYNRVADKRMADWLIERVPWRTSSTPEAVKVAREAAQRRLAYGKKAIDAIQRAIRGESLPTGTVNAIERLFPHLKGRLREPTRIRVQDVLKAAKTVSRPERVLEVPKIGAIAKLRKLIVEAEQRLALNPGSPALQREVSRLKGNLGFIRYRIGLGTPLTLPHNVVKALRQDAIVELRELLDAIRGTRVARPGQKTPRFEGGLMDDLRKEVAETLKKTQAAREQALRTTFEEATIPAPAFTGKIFTGPEAKETARILRESLDPSFSKALEAVNKVNSVSRYFMLAGDFSVATIQLLYVAGGNPKVYGKAIGGLVEALFDTRSLARYLAKPENMAIMQKYPNLILSQGGATEFTEAMARGGLLRKGPLKIAGKVLEPFQRGFEGALDIAGIEMAKSLDHLGTTAARIDDLSQFINEFRGVTSSARLGVSPRTRQVETTLLLAPRYNRAIAALLFDTVHGGLRGELSRKALARGVAAVAAMGVAISYAKGESNEEVLAHLNPASPTFMTWKIAGQNIGPGTKIRSVMRLFALSAKDPEKLLDTSVGWGELEYMKNPIIKFSRGLSSPAISFSWDLLTGKDYIGDPSRDGLLSFSKTVAKNFMPVWTQTVAFEGGTPLDRAVRGVAEFAGLRAYPRNRIWELSGEWKSDLETYFSIPTDPLDRRAEGIKHDRDSYRASHPDIDAKLFIIGDVTSLKKRRSATEVKRLVAEYGIDPTQIKAVREYQKEQEKREKLGLARAKETFVDRLIRDLIGSRGIGDFQSGYDAVVPTIPPPVVPTKPNPSSEPASRWLEVRPDLKADSLAALNKVWFGQGRLTRPEERELKVVFEKHPFGQTNFNTWMKQTLRQIHEVDTLAA